MVKQFKLYVDFSLGGKGVLCKSPISKSMNDLQQFRPHTRFHSQAEAQRKQMARGPRHTANHHGGPAFTVPSVTSTTSALREDGSYPGSEV